VIGMSTGAFSWFVLLSFLVSLGHGRFSSKTLVRMSHWSGGCMLAAALVVAIRLIRLLALH